MHTLFLILLALTAYFAAASRSRDAERMEAVDVEDAPPATDLLIIELEKVDAGYHAAVIDLSDAAILHVTDTYADVSAAVREAQTWIHANS